MTKVRKPRHNLNIGIYTNTLPQIAKRFEKHTFRASMIVHLSKLLKKRRFTLKLSGWNRPSGGSPRNATTFLEHWVESRVA